MLVQYWRKPGRHATCRGQYANECTKGRLPCITLLCRFPPWGLLRWARYWLLSLPPQQPQRRSQRHAAKSHSCAAQHATPCPPQRLQKWVRICKEVVGRASGAVPRFSYSPAMRTANLRWDEATLDRWLTRSASVVPGTSMVFAGLANANDRRAAIAYFKKPVP